MQRYYKSCLLAVELLLVTIYNVIYYGIIGLVIMVVSAVWGHDLFGETGEIVSTLAGTSILSIGHIKNKKLCKQCCS